MDGNSPAVYSKKLHENNMSILMYASSTNYSVYSESLTFERNSTGNLSAFALEKKGWTTKAKSGWFCLA